MGQRLLAEDVLAGQHGPLAHRRVPALARSDHHRVERLFLVQQLAVVLVDLGLFGFADFGEQLLGLCHLAAVDVAEGHDVLAFHVTVQVVAGPPAAGEQADVQFVAGGVRAEHAGGDELRQRGGGDAGRGSLLEQPAPGDLGGGFHEGGLLRGGMIGLFSNRLRVDMVRAAVTLPY